MKTSLFKYLILSIILVGSLTIPVSEATACGSVTLTAKPQYFLANKNVTSKITAKVIGPDGKPATGTITFSVSSPSSSDKISNKGTANISNGIANITFYHYRSNPGIISISAIATITVKAQDGSLQTFNPTGYIVLYALSVEFLKSGTNSVISKAHVGTDGDPATGKDGETKQFDVKILPEDCKLQFVLSNKEVDVSPKEGKNTTAVTLTGKGSGYSDSELSVQGGDPPNVIAKLPVIIHKPDRVKASGMNTNPPSPGWIGVDSYYYFKVFDIRGRVIADLEGYGYYERLHIDENKDGLIPLGPFSPNLPAELKQNSTPYPGGICSVGTREISDRVRLQIEEGATTEDLGEGAVVMFHNSIYMMAIYLKDSTYQNEFKPVIKKSKVAKLRLRRSKLNDNNKVTEADDDID